MLEKCLTVNGQQIKALVTTMPIREEYDSRYISTLMPIKQGDFS